MFEKYSINKTWKKKIWKKKNIHCVNPIIILSTVYPATTLSALSWRNLKRNYVWNLKKCIEKRETWITGENEKKDKVEEKKKVKGRK